MLNTETYSFVLLIFVDDIPNEIKSRRFVRNAFDFSDVSDHHQTGLQYCQRRKSRRFQKRVQVSSDRRVRQTPKKQVLDNCNKRVEV